MKHKKGVFSLATCIFFASIIFSLQTYCSEGENKQCYELAEKYKKEGNNSQAIYYYKKALEHKPNHLRTIFALGSLLYSESKFNEALECFEKAETLYPNSAQIYFNQSLCHMQKKDTDKTIECLKKAIEKNPDYKKAYNQLGSILHKNKRDKEAIEYLKKSLDKTPNAYNTIFLLAKCLRNVDNLESAKEYFIKAHKLKPESTIAMIELANTYNMLHQPEKAAELYKKVLEINPNQMATKYNLGYTLKKMGRVDETIKIYKEILKEKPDYAQAQFSLALAYLVLGDFQQGWETYEWRWKAYKENKRTFDKPMWDGSNPRGKTILLYAEQGLGDTFQFVRYAKLLKNMGATIIVAAQRPVVKLLQLCKYIDVVVPRGGTLPNFDYYIHLMSLPLQFKTTVDTVPDEIPYLYANPELIDYWKKELGPDKNFKIGICWQGNKGYRSQALKHAVAAKSMHASIFKPLAEIPGVSLYCLQKVNGEEQLKEIDFEIHTFGPDFDKSHGRFMDTAALIKNLDLIVSVDTSVCHVSAALGAQVWTMLPNPADWRWMLKTNKTPWYPNMRLFRQKEYGTWENLMQAVKQEVCKLVGEKNVKASSIDDKSKIEDLPFQETLDKLIILKIKYDDSQDPNIGKELEKTEDQLRKMLLLYKANTDELDTLAEKLYDINSQLIYMDKQISKLEDKSVLNPDFIDLTKRVLLINKLKQHVKKEIKGIIKSK
ncbi:tetratricopeptide repeat protein [Candidatus Dependentiae bacterium]